MRKRMMARTAWGAALMALALTGGMAGSASAQTSERTWLGVATQEITDNLREGLDYRGSGVLVNSVVADSPAERAGLKKGDVLVSFNSRAISTPAGLVEAVRAAKVGQSVSLTVVRDGQRRSLTARLGARPADDGEMFDTPTPRVPRAPRDPDAPSSPRVRTFEWDGNNFNLPEALEGRGFSMLQGLGRGRLGVQIQDMNADLGDALGAAGGKGVLVTDVVKDTPAAKAGIKGGDVITEVGGKAVADVGELQRELRDREGSVAITLLRRGARRTVNPDIGDKPQAMRWESDGDGDGDRRVIRIPDIRREVHRDVRRNVERDMRESDRDRNRDDLEQQVKELREELRELRRKLEAGGRN